jgi:HAD superfamily hydrolase (TIGR01509 family)
MKDDNCKATPGLSTKDLKVIALDCDGVLFDSKEANIRFYSHIMEHIGGPAVRSDQHEYIHMYPVRESLLYLTGGEGPDFDQALDYIKTIDFSPFNRYLTREPGLVDFLKRASTHYKTALATNRTVSTMELLEQFDLRQYFHLVVCALDVANPKPHPETMEKIMETFEVSPQNVLYIGDSRVDEALAKATGVHFVSYKNPTLEAQVHITHFQELSCLFADSETR